jgi:hypothetical protein
MLFLAPSLITSIPSALFQLRPSGASPRSTSDARAAEIDPSAVGQCEIANTKGR